MKVFNTIEKNNKKILIVETTDKAEIACEVIENLKLTGNENEDRLIIQDCIDEADIQADISYEGNLVYSLKKIVSEYRKHQKSETLDNLSYDMYYFLTHACGDIAHYDINGYRYNYNNSFRALENNFLLDETLTTNFSDVDRIFKELKIGKYSKERKDTDLSKLTLDELKDIIEKSNWNVFENGDDWRLQFALDNKNCFEFDLDVSSNNVYNIICSLAKYSKDFDPDKYAKEIIANHIDDPRLISIRDIVFTSERICVRLEELVKNLVYRCRVALETNKQKDLEVEVER